MIVMKFGGTSLGSGERIFNVSQIIARQQDKEPTAVVLSAVSGATNLFEALLAENLRPEASVELFTQAKAKHHNIVNELSEKLPSLEKHHIIADINKEFERCQRDYDALQETPTDTHLRAAIITTGERLSVMIMLAVLNTQGFTASHLPAAQYMAVRRCDKQIDSEHTDTIMRPCINASRDKLAQQPEANTIRVMEGFYGNMANGEYRTFGRNGSDLSAVALGLILQVKRVEIWTDVKGVYTTDPRMVPDAFPVDHMSFDDMARMAHLGATVVYPQAVDELEGSNIELHIKCSMQPEAAGTVISPDEQATHPRDEALGLAAWDKIQIEIGEQHHFINYFDKTAATPKPLFDFEEDENPEHVFHLTHGQRHEMLEMHRAGELALALLSIININEQEEKTLLSYLEAENTVVIDAIDNHIPNALSLVVRSEDLKPIAQQVHHSLFNAKIVAKKKSEMAFSQ